MKLGRAIRIAAMFTRTAAPACGAFVMTFAALSLVACSPSPDPKLAKYAADDQTVAMRLAIFDTLDFDVYSNQKWERLQESHSKDIIVHYPDGHQSVGLVDHIEELKPQFVFAPDTKITTHPIKFGSGDWTSVEGIMEGTFSKPMPIGGGKSIPPTGKKFKLAMVTIGHWKGSVMDEEYLFWDNAAFMKQVGLAK